MEIQDTGLATQQQTEVLKCKNCGMSPTAEDIANWPQDTSQPIPCGFCGASYTRQQRQDDGLQRLRESMAELQQQLVGISLATANGADLGMRSHLFQNDIFPKLKRNADRQLGSFENAPEIPLIPFKPLAGFQEYRPAPQLVDLGRGNNQWLKKLSTQLSAPQVQAFATMPQDQRALKTLQFRIDSLTYYSNIASLLEGIESVSLPIVYRNVQSLQEGYQKFAEEVTDEDYRSYLAALDSRLSGALLLIDTLIPLVEVGRNFIPEAAQTQLERCFQQYEKAEKQARTSTYNPLYTIPLQVGLSKDITVARVISAVIKCYTIVQQNQTLDFPTFQHSLMQYVHSLVPIQSFTQLLGLIDSLHQMLAARSGRTPMPVITDWAWLQPTVEANKRKGMFSAAETAGQPVCHFHPYWIATLNYAEKKGVIFTSGTGRSAFILADATAVNEPIVGCLLANDPLLPGVSNGVSNYTLLDKQFMASPALVPRERAEQMMKQYTLQRVAELGATSFKMIGLIYIPAAYVTYTGKNQSREMVLGYLKFVNQNLRAALGQTHQFLQQYGA